MRLQNLQRLHAIATRLDAVIVVAPGVDEGVALAGSRGVEARPAGVDLPVADANAPGRRLIGLVVNPHWHPMVFRRRRRYASQDAWDRFLETQGVETVDGLNALNSKGGTEYSVDTRTESPFYGALRRAGSLLHDIDMTLGAWHIAGGGQASLAGTGLGEGSPGGGGLATVSGPVVGVAPARTRVPPIILRGVHQARELWSIVAHAAAQGWKGPAAGPVAIESAMGVKGN